MLDTVMLTALIERCAPEQPQASLAKIVRLASGGEPLTIVAIERGRAIPIQASTKSEAIALATEIRLAGAPVRVGLAGIDARDLDRLGLSLSDAFEPCANIRAAGRLLAEDPSRLAPPTSRTAISEGSRLRSPIHLRASDLPVLPEEAVGPPAADRARTAAARSWDVYAQGLRSSTLVYSIRE